MVNWSAKIWGCHDTPGTPRDDRPAAHKRPGIVTVFAWSRSLKKTMVHYIDKPALLYATTYVLQLVVIHTSEEAEEDALFGNSARVRGLKIGGHSSVYSRHRYFEVTNKFCYINPWLPTFRSRLDQKSICRRLFATGFLHIISLPCHFPFASLCTLHYVDWTVGCTGYRL